MAVVVSLLPTNAFFGGMLRTWLTVTEPTSPASVLKVVPAWVCDAMEAWGHVATRVRSYKLSKTYMTAVMCFKCGGSRGSNEVRSPLLLEHRASPTVDVRSLSWFGLEFHQLHAGGTMKGCCRMLEQRSSLWKNGCNIFQLLGATMMRVKNCAR